MSSASGPRDVNFVLPGDVDEQRLPVDCLLGIALVRWDVHGPTEGCEATQLLAAASESRPGRVAPDYHLEYSIVDVSWIDPVPYERGAYEVFAAINVLQFQIVINSF